MDVTEQIEELNKQLDIINDNLINLQQQTSKVYNDRLSKKITLFKQYELLRKILKQKTSLENQKYFVNKQLFLLEDVLMPEVKSDLINQYQTLNNDIDILQSEIDELTKLLPKKNKRQKSAPNLIEQDIEQQIKNKNTELTALLFRRGNIVNSLRKSDDAIRRLKILKKELAKRSTLVESVEHSENMLQDEANKLNLGFTDTLVKPVSEISPASPPKINNDICLDIYKYGLKVNNKYYYPSQFPNLTKINPVSHTVKNGGKKRNERKSRKRMPYIKEQMN